jgi:hypothetical protein
LREPRENALSARGDINWAVGMHQLNPELFREQAQRMLRIAICCDHGAPGEILRDALTVGRALMEWGHSVTYIVGDPTTLAESTASWTPNDVFQAPVRRPVPNLVMKPHAIDGFSDLMAAAGFDDKAALVTLASLWNRQLLALKPDVIIGFYTPLLWLVGPAHAPTFALGSGFMLPPITGTSFPRLSADSAPLADEALMLDNANVALQRNGQLALTALSGILERCVSILYGVPLFDPYLHIRRSLSIGLLGEEPKPAVPPAKERLAALLDVYCPNIEQIVLAVASLDDLPIDICISGATTSMRRFLEQQPHIKVWRDYASLLDQAAIASVLAHHGVQDVAQRAISLGRPQIVIPWTHEQEKFDAVVHGMGFSWTKDPTASIEDMANALRYATRAPDLIITAQHHARQLASARLPDALPKIIELVENSARLRPITALSQPVTALSQPVTLSQNREAENQKA